MNWHVIFAQTLLNLRANSEDSVEVKIVSTITTEAVAIRGIPF